MYQTQFCALRRKWNINVLYINNSNFLKLTILKLYENRKRRGYEVRIYCDHFENTIDIVVVQVWLKKDLFVFKHDHQ